MSPEAGDAWRTVLALEHEAVWTYSLVGARWPELRDDAQDQWRAHQRARDRVLAILAAADETSVAAQQGYGREVPETSRAARGLLVDVEHRLLAAAVELVGSTTGRDRRRALGVLGAASEAATSWGAAPEALPGLSSATRRDR